MRSALSLVALALLCSPALAAESVIAEFGTMPPSVEDGHPTRAAEWRAVQANLKRLAPRIRARAAARAHSPELAYPNDGELTFPLRSKPWAQSFAPDTIQNHVDLSANLQVIKDYACGQRSYAFNGTGHAGNDFSLEPFPWAMMANEEVDVVAALGGTVVFIQDGEPDQNCALSTTARPNAVYVQQDDGMLGVYLHFKSGSLAVTLGDTVEQGQKLGNVGSSGSSTGPHLHYEVDRTNGAPTEPFAGQCNAGATGWRHQWNYNESSILRIATHAVAPSYGTGSNCDHTEPVVQQSFKPGDTVYIAAYVRDAVQGMSGSWQVFDSQGTLQQTATSPQAPVYLSWADFSQPLVLPDDAAPGTWRIRVNFAGQSMEGVFFVGEAPAQTALAAAILPASRSIQANETATAFATLLNGGGTTATGCGIYPAAPLDGAFTFQTTDPQTNAVTGTVNQVVDIPAGQGQSFVIAFVPGSDAVARGLDLPVSFQCANAPAVSSIPGVNTLQLSVSQTPVPDILAIGATASGDGYLDLPGPSGSNAFGLAAIDIGSVGTVTVTPRATNPSGPALSIAICETDPATAACLSAPAPSIASSFAAEQGRTYSIFVTSPSAIADDPAVNRLYVDFTDDQGISRGAASVALRSQ